MECEPLAAFSRLVRQRPPSPAMCVMGTAAPRQAGLPAAQPRTCGGGGIHLDLEAAHQLTRGGQGSGLHVAGGHVGAGVDVCRLKREQVGGAAVDGPCKHGRRPAIPFHAGVPCARRAAPLEGAHLICGCWTYTTGPAGPRWRSRCRPRCTPAGPWRWRQPCAPGRWGTPPPRSRWRWHSCPLSAAPSAAEEERQQRSGETRFGLPARLNQQQHTGQHLRTAASQPWLLAVGGSLRLGWRPLPQSST